MCRHTRFCRLVLAGLVALLTWPVIPLHGQTPTTWYVRTDGGTPEQCTGRVDAPYPGGGIAQPCALKHPFYALPPDDTPLIVGGDTLIIGPGSYRMGFGATGAQNCESAYTWGCHMPPIPSGPSPATPTRILGAGWNSRIGTPPELWGTERSDLILNLTGSSNVQVAWLEITDHSGCVESHSGGLACNRDNYPYGDWAPVGLYAEDSANVLLRDLNIHGLAVTGVHAGRLKDWTVERVRIVGNGWAGWDGDVLGDDANTGTMLFRYWTVEWNGCGETYPGEQPAGCWAQTAGGYGDGVGTGTTGGQWIIEDSRFLYNTSDGLDLLYARLPDSRIEIRRTIAQGNAGNQIKTTGPAIIENCIVVSNCAYFEGQPFTDYVDPCRALGNALSFNLRAGDRVSVVNSTVSGEGDLLIGAEPEDSSNGTERVILRNNIFQGQVEFLSPDDLSALMYQEGFSQGASLFDEDYSLINGVKDDACPGPHDLCGVSPGLRNIGIDTFDAHLLPSSPAIGRALATVAPVDDAQRRYRDSAPDLGALEMRARRLFRRSGRIGPVRPTAAGAAGRIPSNANWARSLSPIRPTAPLR